MDSFPAQTIVILRASLSRRNATPQCWTTPSLSRRSLSLQVFAPVPILRRLRLSHTWGAIPAPCPFPLNLFDFDSSCSASCNWLYKAICSSSRAVIFTGVSSLKTPLDALTNLNPWISNLRGTKLRPKASIHHQQECVQPPCLVYA